MSYSNFTVAKLRSEFGIEIKPRQGLFEEISPRPISPWLKETLAQNLPLAIAVGTEKARSELLVMPLLVEFWQQTKQGVGLFSGKSFNVDKKRGLHGVCDYLISRSPNLFAIEAPVVVLVEAKSDNFTKGLAQCIAEMIAARIFNERTNTGITDIYGVITIGSLWQFLRYRGNLVEVSGEEFPILQADKILGVLWEMVLPNS